MIKEWQLESLCKTTIQKLTNNNLKEMKFILAFFILQITFCIFQTPKARNLSLTLSSPTGKTPARKLGIFTDDKKSKQIIVLKKDLVDMEAEITQNMS